MSSTRASLRTYLSALIEATPDAAYSAAEKNNVINQAIQHLSTPLPQKKRETGTVSGVTITIVRPVTKIDYLIIAGVYWKPLPASQTDFATEYYDLRPNEDEMIITLGASQSSAAYTVSYWSPIDEMDDDTDGGLPDVLKHVLYLGAIAGILTHRLAEANAAATDSQLMTFLKTAVSVHYGRFYDAISLSQAIDDQGIKT